MLRYVLAAVPAMLLPLAAAGQLKREKPPEEAVEPAYKYVAFAGWGYTSLNQVNQSNNGLQGVSLSLTRNWGKYFGVTVEGGHYAWTVTKANPEAASVDMYLAGPELHAPLIGPTSMFVHGLVGAVHTGGVSIQPGQSFAGGIGVGMDYRLNSRFGLRLSGDDIGSAFTVVPYQPGASAHTRFNAHASVGVTYRF